MFKQKVRKVVVASALIFVAMFGVFILRTKAGITDNVTGWIWSGSDDGNATGVGVINAGAGWISMNNTNPGAGGATSYGVSAPTGDGAVTGYAYSENVGYIDFAPHAGCPGSPKYAGACDAYPTAPSNDVQKTGNSLSGWARIVEISKQSAVGNSGGWLGWIKMSGAASDGSPYGVSVNASTGEFSGYAWSDELGAISFRGSNYGAAMPAPPAVTLNASPIFLDLTTTNPSLPNNVTLTWTVANVTSCTKSWGGTTNINGSETVSQSAGLIVYRLDCVGIDGTNTFANVVVQGRCYDHSCASGICQATEKLGVANVSACPTQQCSTDTQCAGSAITNYREVQP